jgi:MinD-like ATPase involved in chromosome partitioning or flagellar assembly
VSVTVLCSAHGAPGVTTSALAMSWVWPLARPDRRVLLVDADPAGSGLLTGYLQAGIPDSAGVAALAAQRGRLSVEDVIERAVAIDPDSARMVLAGVAEPMQARPLAALWTALADVAHDLGAVGVDVVADVGRLGHRYEPAALIESADVVVVVVRADVASAVPAAAAVRSLRAGRPGRVAPVALVVGSGYSPAEIGAALGVDETLALASDGWAATALASGGAQGWRFERSPLLRSARSVVDRLSELAPDPHLVAGS